MAVLRTLRREDRAVIHPDRQRVVRLGEALSGELRVEMITLLKSVDDMSPGTVAEALGHRASTVKRHLGYLAERHLIAPARMEHPASADEGGISLNGIERSWRLTPEFRDVIESVDDFHALGRALAHKSRVDILLGLVLGGDSSAWRLARTLNLNQAVVSRHLRCLSELHMVAPAQIDPDAARPPFSLRWSLSRKGRLVMGSLPAYCRLVERLTEQGGASNGKAAAPV